MSIIYSHGRDSRLADHGTAGLVTGSTAQGTGRQPTVAETARMLRTGQYDFDGPYTLPSVLRRAREYDQRP